MLIGAPLPHTPTSPQEWISALQERGYNAAYWPLPLDTVDTEAQAFRQAADEAKIVIAEVGAWSNPISPDLPTHQEAMETCKRALALADSIGARCCVNIAGSRSSKQWDGPDANNLTAETFELIVTSVREIIDDVRPQHTFYTLETMPWIAPTSAAQYLELIRAIDRPSFAVHLDPCNLISSVNDLYHSTDLIDSMFELLRPHIRSCHAKDLTLEPTPPLRFREVAPGKGQVDLPRIIRHLQKSPQIPFMIEHLEDDASYQAAATYIRSLHNTGA